MMSKIVFQKTLKYPVFLFIVIFLMVGFVASDVFAGTPQEIIVSKNQTPINTRMQRKIEMNIRDMNVVDVIKTFASKDKGDFNFVVSPSVTGRVTVNVKGVTIQDALDIVVMSNHSAYKVESNIVQIMTEAEYESMFGKRFGDRTAVKIIHLKYSKPSYVLAALDSIKSNVGRIIIDEDTGAVVMIDTPQVLDMMTTALREIEKPLETFVFSLQYSNADVIADKLRARIDAKSVGSITPDERSNKLIIRVYPDRKKEILAILKELDVTSKEVLIDARILQLVFKPNYDLGVDWKLDFRDTNSKELPKVDFNSQYLNASGISSSDKLFSNFGQIAIGDFSRDMFELKLRAMQQVSDTKILSNPKILVVDRAEAKIHIGDTVPYIISTTSGTGDNAITSEDVRFVDVGLKLNVTPAINDEGFVTMRLRPEISTVVASISSAGGGIPQVNKTEVETTVIVKDGHTIVMGGLKKDDKVHTKKGFPVLMDLPLFGPMFGRTSDNFTETEIVIFITPHIVDGSQDYYESESTIKPFKSYHN